MLFLKSNTENNSDDSKLKGVRHAFVRYIDCDKLKHLIEASVMSDTEVIGMAESIRSFGLLNPIRVYYDAVTKEYSIISGERRYSALKLLGRNRILCHVITDIQTRDATIIAEYCLSSQTDPFRAGAALEFLINTRGYTINNLSRLSGISFNRIKNLLKLSRLSYEERRLLLTSHMPEQVCAEIADIEETDIRLAVVNYLANHRPDIKKIAEASKKTKRKSFGFNFKLIDNSIARLTEMIEKNGASAKIDRSDREQGVTYTINVTNQNKSTV